ncbi:MAG: hypothetical protein H6897_04670 [Rhodobacteraceae bacterium]|jgi:hypothetical protein|uniref:hypothetical protein n=1 Tax=Albidovulum sp. TaxID=1872424 RepID=UPI001DA8AE3D|nr:hypothetical protein [uncultured Defluviimonas sp.]MCB2126938.1 hypothetical protein [Paracoccaceae bacterium]MCC0069205.1 hypothetical protein [Paracoccaceae bacterium]
MVDRNMQNFYGRLGRIERTHEAGGGFEADGTLGMSYYNSRRRPTRRFGLLGPLVLVAMTVIAIKAAVLATIGPERYEERLVALHAGSSVEQGGAWVLQADPLTVALAERLRAVIY